MKLQDLELSMDDFWDKEIECLDNLSVDEDGLNELLEYLEGIDSPQGWGFLLDTFEELVEEDVYQSWRERAKKVVVLEDDF